LQAETSTAEEYGAAPDASWDGWVKRRTVRNDRNKSLTGQHLIDACGECGLFGALIDTAVRMLHVQEHYQEIDRAEAEGRSTAEIGAKVNAAEDAFYDSQAFADVLNEDQRETLVDTLDYEDRLGWSPTRIRMTAFYMCAMTDPNSYTREKRGLYMPGKQGEQTPPRQKCSAASWNRWSGRSSAPGTPPRSPTTSASTP
jgi:hypothetical protein